MKVKILLVLFVLNSSYNFAQIDNYDSLNFTFDKLSLSEEYDSALVIAQQIRVYALQNNGDTSLRYINSLCNVGKCFNNLFAEDSALTYLNNAYNKLALTGNLESRQAGYCFHLLGLVYENLSEFQLAEINYKKSLQIRSNFLIEYPVDYAKTVNALGDINFYNSNFNLAEEYYLKVLNLDTIGSRELIFFFPTVLSNLGDLYSEMGQFKRAEERYLEALKIAEESFEHHSSKIAPILNDLGVLYSDLGIYDLADKYYKQSLEIRNETHGELNLYSVYILNNLGTLYHELADFQKAEEYFLAANTIVQQLDETISPGTAMISNNLGNLYSDLGDYKSSRELYERSAEIYLELFGEINYDYAMVLNNLSSLFIEMEQYGLSLEYSKRAAEIYKKVFGETHPDYANCIINIGVAYSFQGNYQLAENNYLEASDILLSAFGSVHPLYAQNLCRLGMVNYKKKDFLKAEGYFFLAMEILKKVISESHSTYVELQNDMAYLLIKTQRNFKAYELMNDVFQKKFKQIADNFEWLNDNQKEAYWKKESEFYEGLSYFTNEIHKEVPEAVGLNYNGALLSKSKILEAKISSENYYREVDELREELAYRRRLLAKLESDGSTEKEKLEKLRSESDSIDKRLTLSWPAYAQQKKNLSITWNQVQQYLDKDEAAIEFVRYKNENDSLYYYNALVLKKGDNNPRLIKLCKENDLQAIASSGTYSAYYPLIWQPIDSLLSGVKTIYYSPTGALYSIPFHAIYPAQGQGDNAIPSKKQKRGVVESEDVITEPKAEFLMDRYTLHQLTSTRYLALGLKSKAKVPIGNELALVGGVNYDYLKGRGSSKHHASKDSHSSQRSASQLMRLTYLKGTKLEVEQIHQQAISANWKSAVYQKDEATEERVMQWEGKEAVPILHLATHGFTFPTYDFNDTTISHQSLRYQYRYSTNPMVRSGLLLSGGNWAWMGSDTLSRLGAEQNGILTALEISQLNLKKTQLVVLSACETGLGKVDRSEGTFGLKRGFKLAGVEQLIVSLWPVPDKETMELMTLFYADLMQTQLPVVSFEKAQRAMRQKYPNEPDKWAGFVLVR